MLGKRPERSDRPWHEQILDMLSGKNSSVPAGGTKFEAVNALVVNLRGLRTLGCRFSANGPCRPETHQLGPLSAVQTDHPLTY